MSLIKFFQARRQAIRHQYFDSFVFIHINKTGGSSIKKALDLPFEHKTALEKIEELGREQWEKRFTFAIVRNPWDKVVSHFHYRVQKKRADLATGTVDFKKWVRLAYRDKTPLYHDVPRMFMPQSDWISDRNGKILCNFVGRFETIRADFKKICDTLGKNVELPHIKSSKHEPYRFYYDEETADIVRQLFASDIENFGYQF